MADRNALPALVPRNKKIAAPSPRQRFFVDTIIANPTMSYNEARTLAGYKKSTDIHKILKHPWVNSQLRMHREKLRNEAELKEQDIIKELNNIIEAKASDIFDKETNKFKPMSEWPEYLNKAVKSVRTDRKTNEITGVTFYSRLEALSQLSRILGLNKGSLELNGKFSVSAVENLSDEELEKIIND